VQRELAGDRRAGLAQRRDHGCVDRGRPPVEAGRAGAGRHVGGADGVLHTHGEPEQRAVALQAREHGVGVDRDVRAEVPEPLRASQERLDVLVKFQVP
jgi:hypothetical protein